MISRSPTPMNSGYAFNWTSVEINELNYLSITDSPQMEVVFDLWPIDLRSLQVGFRWQGHVFWNRYIAQLEDVDVGNLHKVAALEKSLGDFQVHYTFQFTFGLYTKSTVWWVPKCDAQGMFLYDIFSNNPCALLLTLWQEIMFILHKLEFSLEYVDHYKSCHLIVHPNCSGEFISLCHH